MKKSQGRKLKTELNYVNIYFETSLFIIRC